MEYGALGARTEPRGTKFSLGWNCGGIARSGIAGRWKGQNTERHDVRPTPASRFVLRGTEDEAGYPSRGLRGKTHRRQICSACARSLASAARILRRTARPSSSGQAKETAKLFCYGFRSGNARHTRLKCKRALITPSAGLVKEADSFFGVGSKPGYTRF